MVPVFGSASGTKDISVAESVPAGTCSAGSSPPEHTLLQKIRTRAGDVPNGRGPEISPENDALARARLRAEEPGVHVLGTGSEEGQHEAGARTWHSQVDPEPGSTLRLLQGFSVKLLGELANFWSTL